MLLWEKARRAAEHVHMRAKCRKGLRHLQAYRPSTHDDEPRWQLAQIEQIAIGEVRRALEPGNGRHGRSPARGDHGLLEGEQLPIHLHGVTPHEASAALVHVGADADRRGVRIRRRDLGSQPPQPRHNRRKVDRGWLAKYDPEIGGPPHLTHSTS